MNRKKIEDMENLNIDNPYAAAYRSKTCQKDDAEKRCCFVEVGSELIPKCKHFTFDNDLPYCDV